MLSIKNLHASIEGTEILRGINLEVKAGEVHAIMGPNGSGKSTLSAVIAGNENFEVTEGQVFLDGEDLADLAPEERAHKGIFLSFQYPVEIPGVATMTFLRTALAVTVTAILTCAFLRADADLFDATAAFLVVVVLVVVVARLLLRGLLRC